MTDTESKNWTVITDDGTQVHVTGRKVLTNDGSLRFVGGDQKTAAIFAKSAWRWAEVEGPAPSDPPASAMPAEEMSQSLLDPEAVEVVYDVLGRKWLSDIEVTDLISDLQNAGVLFLLRSKADEDRGE